MYFFLLLTSAIDAYYSQECDNSYYPLDFSNLSGSKFADINLYSYFQNDGLSINVSFIEGNSSLTYLSEFGTIIFDGNLNFGFGESEIKYKYNCTEIQLNLPSVNKYWNGKQSVWK